MTRHWLSQWANCRCMARFLSLPLYLRPSLANTSRRLALGSYFCTEPLSLELLIPSLGSCNGSTTGFHFWPCPCLSGSLRQLERRRFSRQFILLLLRWDEMVFLLYFASLCNDWTRYTISSREFMQERLLVKGSFWAGISWVVDQYYYRARFEKKRW